MDNVTFPVAAARGGQSWQGFDAPEAPAGGLVTSSSPTPPRMAVNFAKYVTARTKEYQHFPRPA
jgi:hypothetical protein